MTICAALLTQPQVIMSIEINGRTFTGLLAPQQQTAAAGRPPVTGGAGALLPSGGSQGRRPSLSRGALLSSGGLARFPGPRSTGPFASGAAPAESEVGRVTNFLNVLFLGCPSG